MIFKSTAGRGPRKRGLQECSNGAGGVGQAARVGLGPGWGVCEEASPTRRPGRKGPWVSIQTALEEGGGAEGCRGLGLGGRGGHQPLAGCSPSAVVLSLPRHWILLVIWECRRQKPRLLAAPGGQDKGEAPQTPLLEHCQTFRPTPSRVQGCRGPPSLSDCCSWTLPVPQAASRQPSGGRGRRGVGPQLSEVHRRGPQALCSEQFHLPIN